MSTLQTIRGQRRSGLALVAVSAVMWSTGGLIVRFLDVKNSWTISFWRAVFAGLVLLGYVIASERGRTWSSIRSPGLTGALIGACFAAASIAFVFAVSLTNVGNVLVIYATGPFWAALFARLFLRETVAPRIWTSMTAALVGVGLMVSESIGKASVRGDALAFVMPVAFALATVIIRRRSEVTALPGMIYSPILTMMVAGVAAPSLSVSMRDLWLLAVFGAVQLGTGMAIFAIGARRAPSTEVVVVSLLETVLGPLWVWWFVGERMSVRGIWGAAMVLVAIILNAVPDLRRHP